MNGSRLWGEKNDKDTEPNSYREALKCQEKSASRDLVIMANLALRNQIIWPGFLWHMAEPSGKDYVHKLSMAHRPILCKSGRCKLAFLPGKSNLHFIGILASDSGRNIRISNLFLVQNLSQLL